MTRINIVPVKELSDQWLIAEYRELPRVLKQNINIDNAPNNYILGKGHMKWARKHGLFTSRRMQEIIKEMHYRGFKTNFLSDLSSYVKDNIKLDYKPDLKDLELNKERLILKYNKKPNFYRWTKRHKPLYFR